MGMHDAPLECRPPLSPSQIADLRLAASTMTGSKRRAFEAEMTVKYCGGNPLLAETIFGWGRCTVAVGLAERRTGIRCLGAQSAFSGRKRWEAQYPEAAEALEKLAEAHAPVDLLAFPKLQSVVYLYSTALSVLHTQLVYLYSCQRASGFHSREQPHPLCYSDAPGLPESSFSPGISDRAELREYLPNP